MIIFSYDDTKSTNKIKVERIYQNKIEWDICSNIAQIFNIR
jgi:hypothetical protein